MKKLRLHNNSHSLLFTDTYAERNEGEEGTTLDNGEIWGGDEGLLLRNELRAGKTLTVTSWLIKELSEFCSRDADTDEQKLYKRVYERAMGILRDSTVSDGISVPLANIR